MSEKKKVQGKLEWATAHFGVESRYNVLYRDRQGLGGCAEGAHGQARHCHDTTTIRPRHGQKRLRHGWPARRASGSAHTHGLAVEVCRDTNGCIVTGGAGLVSRHSALAAAIRHSSAPRYDAGSCDTRGIARDTACSACMAGVCVAIQTLYLDRGACDTARVIARDMTCDMASAGCDMTGRGPRYGPVRTTTRCCARGLGTVCAQRARSLGHGCVHCAVDPVLTQ